MKLRANRALVYPVGDDLVLVRARGGVSKLSPAERAGLQLKSVEVGGDCSDMPEESIALRLARGDVEIVADEPRAAARKPRKGGR